VVKNLILLIKAELGGISEANDLRDRFGTGSEAGFLAAAEEEGADIFGFSADKERADTFWAADFMSGEGDKICWDRFNRKRDFKESLHGVGMEEGGMVFEQISDILHGESCAGFIIDEHNADEGGIIAERVIDLRGRDAALGIRLNVSDGIALLFQCLNALEDGAMFHGGCNDMFTDASILVERGADCPVIAFSTAGGKEDLFRLTAEDFRDSITAGIH